MYWNVLDESEYFRQISELATLGVFVGDLDGNCLFINKEWEDISGQSSEKALGKGWISVIIEEDIPKVYNIVQQAGKENDKKVSFEFRMLNPIEGVLIIQSTMRVIEHNGSKYFLGCIQDYTPLRTAEEKLKEVNNGLVKSNHEKDRLLQVLAHDLRSPIHAINSLANLLTSETFDKQDGMEMLQLIRDASYNATEMIRSVVDATINNHAEKINKKKINLNVLLERTTNLLQHKANVKQQIIVLKADQEAWISIDEEKIGRVINNLISNSIKFSGHRSVITVSLAVQEHHALISINDQGIGIPEDLQPRVFELFTEAKRYGTDNEQPFGLGLAICKRIIEAHDGRIWFDSETDKGTTFYIELEIDQ